MSGGYSPVYLAVEARDVERLVALLARGESPGGEQWPEADGHFESPLHLAASASDIDMVDALLEAGADRLARDWQGATPLLRALWDDATDEVIDRLLDSASAAIASDPHLAVAPSPLHAVAVADPDVLGVAVATRLLAAGASVTIVDHRGRTPLHVAAAQGHVELVRLLLAHGADPSAIDDDDQTPRDVAANEAVRTCLPDGSASQQGQQLTRALHDALGKGDGAAVLRLLRPGVDLTVSDRHGMFPLHHVAQHRLPELVAPLLAHGADLEVGHTGRKEPIFEDYPPLMLALKRDYAAFGWTTVDAFVDAGADLVRQRGKAPFMETTPLHLAASSGHLRLVERCLAAGADPNALDGYGSAPLRCGITHPAVVRRLLPETDAQRLETVLLLAPPAELVRELVEAGADLETRNVNDGGTPLHWAAQRGQLELARALVEAGADPRARDGAGREPWQRVGAGQGELLALLEAASSGRTPA